jgi:hypothetical protein
MKILPCALDNLLSVTDSFLDSANRIPQGLYATFWSSWKEEMDAVKGCWD